MNKIIKRKRYNTESAVKLGEWDNGQQTELISFCRERLYRTQSGNYFLHGVGGALTKYATFNTIDGEGGEEIIPMTFEQAKEWAEKKLSGDEYETIFGGIEESESSYYVYGSERTVVTLPPDILQSLREKKEATGAAVSWLIKKALQDAGYGDKK